MGIFSSRIRPLESDPELAPTADRIILPRATTIEQYAFYNCKDLTSLVIPAGVTTIEAFAFSGCEGLTSFVIPEGVTTIGACALQGCAGLTSLVIPAGVVTIGPYAFDRCTSLKVVYIMCNENASFSVLRAKMSPSFRGQNVEFKCIPEKSIGNIINKIKLHLSGKSLELNIHPTNLGVALERPGNHPLSIFTPQALQYNNFLAGEPHRQRILTDVRNLFIACRWSLAQQVTPLPHELWECIFSFIFYQVLGPRNFNQLMKSLHTRGFVSYHKKGPLLSAIQQ